MVFSKDVKKIEGKSVGCKESLVELLKKQDDRREHIIDFLICRPNSVIQLYIKSAEST